MRTGESPGGTVAVTAFRASALKLEWEGYYTDMKENRSIEDELVDDMIVNPIEIDPTDCDGDSAEYEDIDEVDDYKETYDEYRQRMELQRKANTPGMNIAVVVGLLLIVAICIGLGFLLC